MGVALSFSVCFEAVTGHTPLRWQKRLFERLVEGDIPSRCDLPTGLGKTSIIPIWLIALASKAGIDGACGLPCRLVYVVNRRTVVDQATDVVERMRERLRIPCREQWNTHETTLKELALRLRRCSASDGEDAPFGVSTLRGEWADNKEWKTDPSQPAIIVGTVDMIGSKLLFSGYGDGRYGRAHHAGLIGQDALIIHDEAHLSPAFDALLQDIATEQMRSHEARPIRVMGLSATMQAGSDHGGDAAAVFGIDEDDHKDRVVSQRLGACKCLTTVKAENGKGVATIAEEALRLGGQPSRVLVYVRSPGAAARIAATIANSIGDGGDSRVALLTGTIRGYERDALTKGPVLTSFQPSAAREAPIESMFLVSTSAGEVGVDWDADHMVCDLSTIDSMAQRFGRVNRLGGEGRFARIIVVQDKISDNDPLADQRRNSAEVLRTLPRANGSPESDSALNASPANLSKVLSRPKAQTAFSPKPTILPATDILFDQRSLTSIAGEMPGRPAIEPYLHGVAEWEPAETHVAWRADIAILSRAGGTDEQGAEVPCSTAELEAVFDIFPLRSVEQLRDRTDCVQKQLEVILERLKIASQKSANHISGADQFEPESETDDEIVPGNTLPARTAADPWVVLLRGSSVRWTRLSELAPKEKRASESARRLLAFATIVLPVEAGGLTKNGTLDGAVHASGGPASLDVAEATAAGTQDRRRVIVTENDGQASP